MVTGINKIIEEIKRHRPEFITGSIKDLKDEIIKNVKPVGTGGFLVNSGSDLSIISYHPTSTKIKYNKYSYDQVLQYFFDKEYNS